MKIICLLILVTVLGCGSDDSNNSGELVVNAQNIVGRWYIAGGTTNGVAFEYDHKCSTSRDYQDILADQTITFIGYNSACDVAEEESSTWHLSGNTLTITNFDPVISGGDFYTVQSVTADRLVLKSTYNTPDGQVEEISNFDRG